MIPARRPAGLLSAYLSLLDIQRYRLPDWLFILGMIQLFLYFPSGLLHVFLGKMVYGRDALLLFSNVVFIWFLYYRQGRNIPLSYVIPLGLFLVMVLPGAFVPGGRRQFLLMAKHIALWNFCIMYGYHIYANLTRRHAELLFIAMMVYLLGESFVGFLESKRIFLFNRAMLAQEETIFGKSVARDNRIMGWVRLNGLQRAPQEFASLMAMGWILSWVGVLMNRFNTWGGAIRRVLFAGMGLWFAYLSFICGIRSGLLGIAVMSPVVIMTLFGFHRNSILMRCYALFAWLGTTLMIFLNFPVILGLLATLFLGDLPVASISSAVERMMWWGFIFSDIDKYPTILLMGYQWTEVFTTYVSRIIVWDNQTMFVLFYGGLPVLLSIHLLFISSIVRLPRLPSNRNIPAFCYLFILLVAYQYGESFSRETLLLPTAWILFVCLGMNLALQAQLSRNPRLAPMLLGLIPQMPPPPPGRGGWREPPPEQGWNPAIPAQARGPRPVPHPGLRPPISR